MIRGGSWQWWASASQAVIFSICLFLVKQRFGSACKAPLLPDWQCNRYQHLSLQVACPYGGSSRLLLGRWFSQMLIITQAPLLSPAPAEGPTKSRWGWLFQSYCSYLGVWKSLLVWPCAETILPWETLLVAPSIMGQPHPLIHNKADIGGDLQRSATLFIKLPQLFGPDKRQKSAGWIRDSCNIL